jgi:hypothetical protein
MSLIEEIKAKADELLKKNEYEELWDYLRANEKDVFSNDNLSSFYWTCVLERQDMKMTGSHGILGRISNVDEAVSVFNRLKIQIQHLEWWPETTAASVLDIMTEYELTAFDLSWAIKAFSFDAEYVMSRLQGEKARPLPFTKPETDISSPEKVCFISCCNNEEELVEMNAYLKRLEIPENVTVDSLEIWEASSMCSGYNEGMKASDAKYKVYLHQDVRIINPYFIYEIINAFHANPDAGLIGLNGTKEIPESGVMWDVDRFGELIEVNIHKTGLVGKKNPETTDAELVDGFIMATQVDIEWREDLFKGWDFYDASQCMEMKRKNHKIMIAGQQSPWTMHDAGFLHLTTYDEHKEIFLKEYMK